MVDIQSPTDEIRRGKKKKDGKKKPQDENIMSASATRQVTPSTYRRYIELYLSTQGGHKNPNSKKTSS